MTTAHGVPGSTDPAPSPRITLDSVLSSDFADPEFLALLADARVRRELINALVQARLAAGIKQQELARALELSKATVSEFEAQSTDPRLSTVQRYARALGCELQIHLRPTTAAAWSHAFSCDNGRGTYTFLDFGTPVARQGLTGAWASADSKRTDYAPAA